MAIGSPAQPVSQVIERGDIYWLDWSPSRGSEQAGHRPAVVVSPRSRNTHMPTVVVCAMTTTIRENTRFGRSPITMYLPAGDPMDNEGAILGFQVLTVAKERLDEYVSSLSSGQIVQLDGVIRASFGLSN